MSEAQLPILTRPMRDDDLPAVIDLLERTLGRAPGDVDRGELFAWKHARNPFGGSIALVAESRGEVVGLRSFMRWDLQAGDGAVIHAVRAVDTVTASSAQRRGVFSRLTTEALETCRREGVRFVFNTPNDKSRPGYLKMGWQVVGAWPIRMKIRRPDRLLMAALRRDLHAGAAVPPPPGSALIPTVDPTALGALAAASGWPASPVGLHTVRSPAYLRWRYADGPLRYHMMLNRDAMVVVRLRARGRLREAVVCEALCASGAERTLRRLLEAVPSEARADHAFAYAGTGSPAADLLRTSGYRRIPKAGRLTFTVRPVLASEPDPLDASAWALTLGDLEVF